MIKKEDFKKLKQLDRIEYLLRLKRIEEKNKAGCLLFVFHLIAIICGILILVSILVFMVGGKEALCNFAKAFPLISCGLSFFFVLSLFTDLYNILRFNKERKELESEFFKQEVKPRN